MYSGFGGANNTKASSSVGMAHIVVANESCHRFRFILAEPINSASDALRIVRFYELRWRVEEYASSEVR
jgi:hypothetical protein